MVLAPALVPVLVASLVAAAAPKKDLCAVVGGQKWVSTQDLRACFQSIPNDPKLKTNILDVVEKTLAFHTSVSYQAKAPEPFTADVHEDILGDIARIRRTKYSNDLDFHIDLQRSVKRLNDGHCAYINVCFDSLYTSFLPTPLVLLDEGRSQSVHIAPEAFTVASAEFPDEIAFWEQAAGVKLRDISGAKVLAIDGADPFKAVNDNAAITGSFQGFATRQNSFFSSYNRVAGGWNYIMGNFAQQALPLIDSRTLTIQRTGSKRIETIKLPMRARFGTASVPFNSTATLLANNCVAVDGTNGVDANNVAANALPAPVPDTRFRKAPASEKKQAHHFVSALFDDTPRSDVVLPPELTPTGSVLDGGVAQFYQLDKKTGVLALGSFSANDFTQFEQDLLDGLTALKAAGSTQLIVDVTNNGGGFICIAHWLHRIVAGPSAKTEPQAGLDTETRAGPLAQLIVDKIIAGADPNNFLLYNPLNWRFANNTPFPGNFDFVDPGAPKVINGRKDRFSTRIGQECQPFDITPPTTALFDPKKVVIISNGRCASSCSLFSIGMVKKEGSKGIVMGGQKTSKQQYCGTVGGQSTDFSTMDTEVKTTGLKSNPLAPPDFLTNSVQGITWRLGFGVDVPTEPEEWQDHPAGRVGFTAATVNNPVAIWKSVAAAEF